MTPALDIYSAANVLVREYGAVQVPIMAARRADALIGLRDVDGQHVWKQCCAQCSNCSGVIDGRMSG